MRKNIIYAAISLLAFTLSILFYTNSAIETKSFLFWVCVTIPIFGHEIYQIAVKQTKRHKDVKLKILYRYYGTTVDNFIILGEQKVTTSWETAGIFTRDDKISNLAFSKKFEEVGIYNSIKDMGQMDKLYIGDLCVFLIDGDGAIFAELYSEEEFKIVN